MSTLTMRRRWTAVTRSACCAAALLMCVAASPPPPSPSEVIAEAGGVTITVADVLQLLDSVNPALRQQLAHDRAALLQLVQSQLVRQELLDAAKSAKWDQTPGIAYRAQMAHDAVIADTYLASLNRPDPAYPAEAEVQAAYAANETRFVQPREYHLAQIFLAEPAGATKQTSDRLRNKLRDLRQTLLRPKADFAEAARRVSQDKASAAHGGDLGWVREDQLVPAIRQAVAGLPAGGISDPVHIGDGWHLLELVATKPATTQPLAQVRDKLVTLLRQQKAAENERAYLKKLQEQKPAEINEIVLSRLLAP